MSQQPGTSGGRSVLEFIQRKGGTILLHAGHQFTKKTTNKNGETTWECHLRKKTKCTGTMKINKVSKYTLAGEKKW